MPKQTTTAEKLEALEVRTQRLEIIARAALALVELFQANKETKHE